MRAVKTQTLCIDATNLIRVCYGHAPGFRDQEDADSVRLLAILDRLGEEGGARLDVEVFFDGVPRSLRPRSGNVRVRFAAGESSDDLIIDRVRLSRQNGSGRVTVVTGDAELGRRVREEGGRWVVVRQRAEFETVLDSLFNGPSA